MHSNINDCCSLRTGPEWCALSGDCIGWGCRLLTIVPETLPSSVKERARLFSRVYRTAEELGVLTCPYFNERYLDSAVEDDILLSKIKKLAKNLHI